MISCGVEISIAGGEGEMVRVLSLGGSFFYFYFISCVIYFRYKKPYVT